MFKRVRGVLWAIVVISTFTFVGCSNTSDTNKEVDTSNIKTEENKNSLEYNRLVLDHITILTIGEPVFSFISDTAKELTTYYNNDDMEGFMTYCKNIIGDGRKIEYVENNLYSLDYKLSTEEGKELYMEIVNLYARYIDLLELFSEGDFSDLTKAELKSVSDDMNEIIKKINDTQF